MNKFGVQANHWGRCKAKNRFRFFTKRSIGSVSGSSASGNVLYMGRDPPPGGAHGTRRGRRRGGGGGGDLETAAALAALPPGVVGDEEIPRELGGRGGGGPGTYLPPPSPVSRRPDSRVSVGTPLKPGATGFKVACEKKTW